MAECPRHPSRNGCPNLGEMLTFSRVQIPPTILIADDDEGLLILIENSLRREGYEVATASSGSAAVEWLSTHPVDLLLLDLKLADIEGPELVSRLIKQGHSGRFITITGQGDERVAVEMMKRGALDYLVKDGRFLEFVPAVVRRALEQVTREEKLAVAEAALKREHNFTAAILQTVGALVVVMDREGRIIRFNRACEECTGYLANEVLGLSCLERFIAPEDLERVKRVFQQSLEGTLPTRHEYAWVTKAGERRLTTWSNTVLRAADGAIEFIVGTGIDETARKRLEQEILEVSDREQRRIGHDLHDGLGQQLTALELQGQALVGKLKTAAPVLVEPAREICRQIRQTITQTRLISHGLSPVPQGEDGLMTALDELAASTTGMETACCEFICPEPVQVTSVLVATNLFRIAQEAVNNSLKHSGAKRIRVTLTEDPDRLKLLVQDNGTGFPLRRGKGSGLGLRIMSYRAQLIGATLEVESGDPGEGVRLMCVLGKKR